MSKKHIIGIISASVLSLGLITSIVNGAISPEINLGSIRNIIS